MYDRRPGRSAVYVVVVLTNRIEHIRKRLLTEVLCRCCSRISNEGELVFVEYATKRSSTVVELAEEYRRTDFRQNLCQMRSRSERHLVRNPFSSVFSVKLSDRDSRLVIRKVINIYNAYVFIRITTSRSYV